MRKGAVAMGVGGAMLSAIGAVVAILVDPFWAVPAGVLVHLGGAWLAVAAAARRRSEPLEPAERDTVIVLATLVPVVGPAVAWSVPRPEDDENENAQEVLERYLEHVKPRIPEYERTLFTGDHDRDLARKLDAESFLEVLRHGDKDRKRSALFHLAELGEPHHLALVRRCLEDPDQEIRLYAYGELDRLTRRHERAIAEARRLEEEEPRSAEAKKALARAHQGLAASGVLDAATARFHDRAAVAYAVSARDFASGDTEAYLIEAKAHARLGDLEKADRCLASVGTRERAQPDVALVEAEVAFRMRDFDTARVAAGRLLFEEVELPGWLAALVAAGEPVAEEDGEPVDPPRFLEDTMAEDPAGASSEGSVRLGDTRAEEVPTPSGPRSLDDTRAEEVDP